MKKRRSIKVMISALLSMAMFIGMLASTNPVTVAAATDKNSQNKNIYDFSKVKSGDVITFGSYEQDNDLENGAEPIEWIVLSTNKGKALLLSKYIIDHRFYDENDYYDDYLKERFPDGEGGIDWDSVNIPWEECTLSVWLNTDFYNSALIRQKKS